MKEGIYAFENRGQYHRRSQNIDDLTEAQVEEIVINAMDAGCVVSDDLEVEHVEIWTVNMEPVG